MAAWLRANFAKKKKAMLTLQYLRKILFQPDPQNPVKSLPELEGLTDPDWIMECRSGMGGAVEIIQNKDLPVCLVLEHPERHGLSLRNDGGFHECTPSLWIMEMVSGEETAESVMERCYNRFLKLFKVFVKHQDDKDLEGWIENNEMNAYDREAGSYVGYEVFVNFREYENLGYGE